jgi:hypothetical protein
MKINFKINQPLGDQKMWTQILSFLTAFAPFIEPVLLNIENNEIQPELKKLIATIPNSGSTASLYNLLMGIDTALDQFVKAEISKV